MPKVTALNIYPVKSCRGIALDDATVGARGLDGDRRYMVVDAKGTFVTQRQYPRMALIDVAAIPHGWRVSAPDHGSIDLPASLTAGHDGASHCKVRVWRQHVDATLAPADTNIWFSSVLGFACGLVNMSDDQHRPVENESAAFDDEVSFADGSPVLLISEASLSELNSRLELPVQMANFRPNIVVSADRAHAEDDWASIGIGTARFEVAWACSRCIMTRVDLQTGAMRDDGEPMRTLKSYRLRGRAVYFGQNLLPRQMGRIAVGDTVEMV